MLLRITINDNDFTEYLEQFAEDPAICVYTRFRKDLSQDEMLEFFKHNDRFRELFYNTDKYTPDLINELCESIKYNWELFVKYILHLEEWQDDDTREYLIKNFKVKFQKSLTPRWENGEVVYICLGYYNKWWTF